MKPACFLPKTNPKSQKVHVLKNEEYVPKIAKSHSFQETSCPTPPIQISETKIPTPSNPTSQSKVYKPKETGSHLGSGKLPRKKVLTSKKSQEEKNR